MTLPAPPLPPGGSYASPRARQLRASDRPTGAGWSGSERRRGGLAARFRLNHADLDSFPKLRVVGSSPIARLTGKPRNLGFLSSCGGLSRGVRRPM